MRKESTARSYVTLVCKDREVLQLMDMACPNKTVEEKVAETRQIPATGLCDQREEERIQGRGSSCHGPIGGRGEEESQENGGHRNAAPVAAFSTIGFYS